MSADQKTIEMLSREYPYGFVTDIEEDSVPAGLSEADVGVGLPKAPQS